MQRTSGSRSFSSFIHEFKQSGHFGSHTIRNSPVLLVEGAQEEDLALNLPFKSGG